MVTLKGSYQDAFKSTWWTFGQPNIFYEQRVSKRMQQLRKTDRRCLSWSKTYQFCRGVLEERCQRDFQPVHPQCFRLLLKNLKKVSTKELVLFKSEKKIIFTLCSQCCIFRYMLYQPTNLNAMKNSLCSTSS
ncbi:hypothetical protein CAEBREN_12500 [Caenorhabditis brenneri]|uniref:Uncharacterized protein n=1 Tax=Caenorhabditis brenneri TaxID=135651 RepID=G0MYK1_CAEBE|nr:hypothetical protein CAEBREN_12500 [Caenorhabditis brenneri]